MLLIDLRKTTLNSLNYKVVKRINRRAKRVSIKIKSHELVEIVIPSTRFEKTAADFFEEKKIWVENQLIRLNAFVEKFEVKIGGDIPVWGNKFHIRFQECDNIHLTQCDLVIPAKSSHLIKLEIRQFLKKELMNYLRKQVPHLAKLMGLEYKIFTIKDTKSRWGSCSYDKELTLALRLIFLDKKIVDYVIIHELAHLKHMDHSKEFWSLVGQHCPNYKHIRNALKKAPLVLI
jgi:predicted metal-dependent hydrolase